MKFNQIFAGVGKRYAAPSVTVTEVAIEQGFQTSLPGVEIEDEDPWAIVE